MRVVVGVVLQGERLEGGVDDLLLGGRHDLEHGVRIEAIGPVDIGVAPSVVVEPFLDQLLGRDPTGRIEAAVLEELLVLEVDVVLAAAVLLDRWPPPSRGSAAPGTD